MHTLATLTEARAIAASYGLSLTDKAMGEDVERANSYANVAPSANALASRQWCEDHPRTVRTKLVCPRETLAYWYVQNAQEIRIEALDGARNAQWAFG
jgi:hypothetical protein